LSHEQTNVEQWTDAAGRGMRVYGSRTLRPVETIVLARYRDDLAGRVLELGCGAGRLTGYLAALAAEVEAVELSEQMLAACRAAYPEVRLRQGDLRDLDGYGDGAFGAVVAGYNLIDVLDDDERRAQLRRVHRILRPGGLFVFSSHNLGAAHRIRGPLQPRTSDPARFAYDLLRAPIKLRNARRARPLQRRADDHAILNDEAHDHALLHYYIGRDAQERQLVETGFELLECLDLDGRAVLPGEAAAHCTELHYLARRAT
jgi:SAM-dependent methyltransferase